MFLIRFIGSFLFASAVTVGGSIVWPKLTTSPRPEVLEKIYDAVLTTDIGQNIEAVLGESIGDGNLKEAVSSVSATVVSNVGVVIQKKAEEIIQSRIAEELIRRYEVLPTFDQEKVRTAVCQ